MEGVAANSHETKDDEKKEFVSTQIHNMQINIKVESSGLLTDAVVTASESCCSFDLHPLYPNDC